MTATVSIAMPGGWRLISAGADRDAQIGAAVEAAYAKADRDSSAVAKHWMRTRLTAAFTAPEDVDAEVVAVAYPEKPVGGVLLPVSATVLRLGQRTHTQDEAMRALALMSTQVPQAKIMETPLGIALRTHAVRDATELFAQEVEDAPIDGAERAAIREAVDSVPSLRARYVLPSGDGAPWHALAFSAMLGAEDEALTVHYLELFDAFVQTLSRREA